MSAQRFITMTLLFGILVFSRCTGNVEYVQTTRTTGPSATGQKQAAKPVKAPRPAEKRVAAKKEVARAPVKSILVRSGSLAKTPLKNQLTDLRLEEPITHGNLTLYPVSSDIPFVAHKIQTVDAAFKAKMLTVSEEGSGTVPFITVSKTTKDSVFIMTGEMFIGARQDRISKHDVLLPSRPGKHRLPVYCVEQGRWHGSTQQFKSGNVMGSKNLRKSAIKKRGQAKIWEEVAKKTNQVKAKTETQTMNASYKSEIYRKKSPAYLKKLRGFASRHAKSLGVVATINSSVVSVDIFANHDLFVDLHEKLLKSYVLDAVDPHFKGSNFPAAKIHDFLAQASTARFNESKSTGTGSGKEYIISSDEVAGTLLKANDRVVHFALLSEKEGRKRKFEEAPKVAASSDDSSYKETDSKASYKYRNRSVKGYKGKSLKDKLSFKLKYSRRSKEKKYRCPKGKEYYQKKGKHPAKSYRKKVYPKKDKTPAGESKARYKTSKPYYKKKHARKGK